MRSGPKLVIFDVDGTLIDSQDHILAAMTRAFAVTGQVLPPRAAVLGIVGLSLPQAVSRLVPDTAEDIRDQIVDAYKQSFNGQRSLSPPPSLYPGARQVLDDLRRRDDVILGVATGKSRRGLDQMIAAHGLQDYFQTIQVADNHPSKPHPAMIHAAMVEAGVTKADSVMIGDTSFDIDMGRAAGVATIGVGWGYHPIDVLHAAGAGRVIANYAALLPALEEIWASR